MVRACGGCARRRRDIKRFAAYMRSAGRVPERGSRVRVSAGCPTLRCTYCVRLALTRIHACTRICYGDLGRRGRPYKVPSAPVSAYHPPPLASMPDITPITSLEQFHTIVRFLSLAHTVSGEADA